LDISGKAVGFAATVIIVVFLGAAYCLYQRNFGVTAADSAYLLKVADAFINGAIVGVLFAILRAMFELPKLLPFLK
jgi:hypothetical protein